MTACWTELNYLVCINPSVCKLKKEIMRIQQGNENSLVYSEPFKDSSRESDGNKKKKEEKKTRPWIRTVQPSAVSVAPWSGRQPCCLHGKVWVTFMFLLVQFRQRQERLRSHTPGMRKKQRREKKNAPEVSAGILMASIMLTIIGSNWGAIILHFQSNVSLNMKACADVSAFFPFCLLCVWKVPRLKEKK